MILHDNIPIYQCPECGRLLLGPIIKENTKKCPCGHIFGDINTDMQQWEVRK